MNIKPITNKVYKILIKLIKCLKKKNSKKEK